MNYQYVIIQGNTDYYEIITRRTSMNREAIVINGLFDHHPTFIKKVLNNIYRFATKFRLIFLLRLLACLMIKIDINPTQDICFLVWSWYANDVNDYLGEYLRKKYTNCRIVCRFEDIIEKMPYKNIEDYRDAFDYLCTFDEMEAKKYNIDYFPSWYDICDLDLNSTQYDIDSDVLFIGRGKDRMKEIIHVFEILEKRGVNCLFYLVDVPLADQKHKDKIIYGKCLPYEQILGLIKKTKCLLEILQKDAISETLRVFESIAYNKKLITNNDLILSRDYYSPDKIYYYKNPTDIDINFILKETNQAKYDQRYLDRMRPINMLEFIDKKMNDTNGQP